MWATEWFLKWEVKVLVDKLREKEEEIKKLKSDLSLVIKERDDNIKQNKKLNEYNRRLKQANDDLKVQNKKLREENKRLSDFLNYDWE